VTSKLVQHDVIADPPSFNICVRGFYLIRSKLVQILDLEDDDDAEAAQINGNWSDNSDL